MMRLGIMQHSLGGEVPMEEFFAKAAAFGASVVGAILRERNRETCA